MLPLLLTLAMLPLLCSCERRDNDVFEKPAMQRMSETVAHYTGILSAAQHGWIMEYFASDNLVGGYTFACTFGEDGTVTTIADLSTDGYTPGAPQKSLYRITSDRGAVLSFDSYSVFHTLSEPRGGSMGNTSYGGDYEFVITRASADSIFLKGKKHGRPLLMLPLAEPAGERISRLVEAEKSMDSPRMRITVGGQEFACVKEDYRLLRIYHSNGEARPYPFIYTAQGMKLLHPLTLAGLSVQEFRIDSDGKTLKGVDANVTLPYPTSVELSMANEQWGFNFYYNHDTVVYRDTLKLLVSEKMDTTYLSADSVKYTYELVARDTVLVDTVVYSYTVLDSTSMCSELFGVLQKAAADGYSAYGEILGGLYIGVNGVYITDRHVDPSPYAFVFTSGGYSISYGLHFKDDGSGNLDITPTVPGLNFESSSYLLPVVTYIGDNAPYRLEPQQAAPGGAGRTKFVSAKNGNVWFVLQGDDN
jgi:hypothetical protein